MYICKPSGKSLIKLNLALVLSVSGAVEAGSSMKIDCPNENIRLNIQTQDMGRALNTLAQQSGFQVIFYSDIAKNIAVKPIIGEYSTCSEAIDALLAGTNLSYSVIADKTIAIHDTDKNKAQEDDMLLASNGRLPLVKRGAAAVEATRGEDTTIIDGHQAFGVIEEIRVTSQKREQNIFDVPMTVAALSGDQLDAQSVNDLQSLSLVVPGLLVAESGSFQRRISIRGIGNTFGSSSLVGMYVDEASVASIPANQIDLRIYDLERIEVLKGPQGTLYGQGSVGGTIRYITRDPQLEGFVGKVSLDGASTRDGASSQNIKSVLNIPLAANAGARVVTQYVNSGGWIDQPALGRENINNYELFNVRAKLLWQPVENLELKTTAIVHRNDVGAQNVGENTDGNYRQAFDDPSTPSADDRYELYNLLVNYDFDGYSLVSSSSYLDSGKLINNFGYQCCYPTATGDQLWHVLASRFQTSADILTQEILLNTDGSDAWNWTLGVFYRDATLIPLNQDGLLGDPDGTLGVDLFEYQNYQEERSRSWAVFGETSYALTEKLEIGGGVRYFNDDRGFRIARRDTFEEERFDSVNPKVFLSYAVSEDIRLYTNIAKGFRSGGFNAGEPHFDPESVWSYEMGTKTSLLDRRLRAELAFFFSIYDDYQVVRVDPETAVNITSNAGRAEIQGIDLSMVWLPRENLELGFSGNYTDSEFTEITAESTSHYVGDPLDLVPQYGYALWAAYSFNWADQMPGFFRVDYTRQGKSYARNRTLGGSDDADQSSGIANMMNTRIGWKHHNWSIELYALNLFNERALLSPYGKNLLAARAQPRTFGINVGFEF